MGLESKILIANIKPETRIEIVFSFFMFIKNFIFFGHKYVGKFKGGLKHGKGTLTFPDGLFKKGKWEFDKLVEEQ